MQHCLQIFSCKVHLHLAQWTVDNWGALEELCGKNGIHLFWSNLVLLTKKAWLYFIFPPSSTSISLHPNVSKMQMGGCCWILQSQKTPNVKRCGKMWEGKKVVDSTGDEQRWMAGRVKCSTWFQRDCSVAGLGPPVTKVGLWVVG